MGNTQITPTAEYFRERPKCLWCNKAIRSFPKRFDWINRRYHRTCYKLYVDDLILKREIEHMKHEAMFREMMAKENTRIRESMLKII